ncbi:MAG: Coenzyme F420 hydrogenase/dehydrogenase, beta subunit C-terminal domain [Candidatus Muiribacteriota bacterium]
MLPFFKNSNEKEKCTGCNSCGNICPTSAIIQKIDSDGFFYPDIDLNKCIKCNKCIEICPENFNKNKQCKVKKVYAGYTLDSNTLFTSTSGGLFSVLAINILKNNGIVFGAAFDNSLNLNHININNSKELSLLKGSKYIQSSINLCFTEAKKALDNNKKILFSGTPCQISGLKSFLNKSYDNLFTIDLICHGVPSFLLFKQYINYIENKIKQKISFIEFRNKKTGWNNSSIKIFSGNKFKRWKKSNDSFSIAFGSRLCLRPCCYKCNYSNLDREGDITLGDFWKIEQFSNNFSTDKGTSLVLLNSQKGIDLFDTVKNSLFYEESKLEYALKVQPRLKSPSQYNILRPTFLNDLKSLNYKQIIKKYKLYKPSLIQRILYKISKKLRKI